MLVHGSSGVQPFGRSWPETAVVGSTTSVSGGRDTMADPSIAPQLPASERFYGAIQVWNRRRKAAWCRDFIHARGIKTVLFIGYSERDVPWENLVERLVAEQCETVVWTGFDPDGPAFAERYVACDGLTLPFADDSIDLVLSNAVVEHVGLPEQQSRFLAEHARVGRYWIATTPNRWFPVETHTKRPLWHYSRRLRMQSTMFTNLLSPSELRSVCSAPAEVRGNGLSVTLTAWGPS